MHLNQLRKAKEFVFAEDQNKVLTGKTLSEVKHALDKAEHFMFTALPEYDEEIEASAAAMKQADVWKLPYPVTTFEFVADFVPIGTRSREGHELLEIDNRRPNSTIVFVALEECVDRDGNMTSLAEAGYVRWIFVRHRTNKLVWLNMAGQLPFDEVNRFFTTLMVALHTRGVRRERWSGDHPVLTGRKEPTNTYTRVLVRETVAQGQGTAVVGDRCKVRLHLRRGHVRQQPYGKGRQYVRLQWIAPVLVGYADEGVVEHEAYVV